MVPPSQPPRLLIVEDDHDVRESLVDLLSEFGYAAQGALDGFNAVEIAEQHGFDLALLDYKMPGMNGVETARRLLTLHPELACVMLTGYADSKVRKGAVDAGIERIISKPIAAPKLLALLNEIVPPE